MSTPIWERQALVLSMLGPMYNKIKMCMEFPKKNIEFAQNKDVKLFIAMLGEQILPQYCRKNMKDAEEINNMHNLMYLFVYKTHQVFQARVIHQIIDQNWDLKGYRAVLMRILEKMGIRKCPQAENLDKYIEKLINGQNLQSTSCIKAIGSFLRKPKEITEDDLRNPIKTYQTTYDFLKTDIERYRHQNIKYECFQILHPWAYDLDQVDMKYIVNPNLEGQICKILAQSEDAQLFWLSFFKPQLSCSADEFFEAVRQFAEINGISGFHASNYQEFDLHMHDSKYVISVEDHADIICKVIQKVVDESMSKGRCNSLKCQYKLYKGAFPGSCYVDNDAMAAGGYTISNSAPFDEYKQDTSTLGAITLTEISPIETCDLQRKIVHLKTLSIPDQRLVLKFEQVDTEELRHIEIAVEGDRAIYKIGEGETAHYHIPNDKKLWETQFMICSIDGKFYIRDMGFVHTTRMKLDQKCEIQLQKGSVVDLGKVVHYHFDKLIHSQTPTVPDSDQFYILRQGKQYDVDAEDFPHLRARPTWVSAEENVENIQNEINIYADDRSKQIHSVGRSMKRDVQIKLKAVSADHCQISYNNAKGWAITEKGKDKQSSNGTYVFLKTLQQSRDHMPSDLIPLHDGMILSFVNYELRVKLVPKTNDEIKAQLKEQSEFFSAKEEELGGIASMSPIFAAAAKGSAPPSAPVEEVAAPASPPVEEAKVVEEVAAPVESPVEAVVEAPVEEVKAVAPVEVPVEAAPVQEEAKAEAPVEAVAPVEEAKPDAPVEAVAPVEEVKADAPVEAVAPVEEAKPDAPVEAVAPVEEAKADAPVEEAKADPVAAVADAPVEEVKADAPVEAAKPDAPVEEAKVDPVAAVADAPVEEAKADPVAAVVDAPVEEAKVDPVAAVADAPVEEAKADAPVAPAEEAKADAPTAPAAAVEEAKADPVAVVADAPVETAKVEEPAAEKKEDVAQAPPAEEAKADAPVLEEAKADAPVEAAKPDAPVEEAKADAPVEAAKPDAPVEEAKADAPVEAAKPDAPVEEAKADAPVEAAKPDAPVEEAKADAPVEAAKPDAPVEEAKADAPVEAAKPDAPVEEAKADAPVEAAKPDAPKEEVKADAPVEAAKPEAPKEEVKADAPVEAAKPDAPVEETKADAPVEAAKPEAPKEEIKADAPVEAAKPDAPVEAAKPDAPKEEVKADAPVEAAKPEAPKEEIKADAPVEAPKADAPVEAAKPEAPKEEVKADAPVEAAKPEAPKEEVKADAPVEAAKPEAPKEEVKAEAPVEAAKPEAPVEAAKPEAPVEAAKPEAPKEEVKADAPVAQPPATETKPEAPKEEEKKDAPVEAPKAEDPKPVDATATKPEEEKKDAPAEAPKAEAPKVEDPKPEDKKDAPVEAPKADAPKAEAPKEEVKTDAPVAQAPATDAKPEEKKDAPVEAPKAEDPKPADATATKPEEEKKD